jgi:hypothetical protein
MKECEKKQPYKQQNFIRSTYFLIMTETTGLYSSIRCITQRISQISNANKLHEFYCSLKLLVSLNQAGYCGLYLFLGWEQKTNADKACISNKVSSLYLNLNEILYREYLFLVYITAGGPPWHSG